MQHTGNPVQRVANTRRIESFAGHFDADRLHVIVKERVEDTDRVRAPADTGNDGVRHYSLFSHDLLPGFVPITDWKSLTIVGNGCGPTTNPIR